MNGYFEPWKRKFGMVALLCAHIFFYGWARCQSPELGPLGGHAEEIGMILLWALALPLSLLSAWLLLSKP
jgi:hypothetical protein